MSNFNFNKVILGGRLTADPELKQTTSGIPMVSFTVAVNRSYASKDQQRETDFFNVTAWRTRAEFVAKFFKKGSAICIVGAIQNRQYTDQQGQKRTFTDIVADEVMFVDSRGDNPAYSTSNPADTFVPNFADNDSAKFKEIKGDEDLPF